MDVRGEGPSISPASWRGGKGKAPSISPGGRRKWRRLAQLIVEEMRKTGPLYLPRQQAGRK